MFLNKKSKGFTVLEMAAVFFFMSLILLAVMVNYRKDKSSLALWRSANSFAQSIRSIQTMAGKENLNCKVDGAYVEGYSHSYGVYIDTSNDESYLIFADCNGDNLYGEGDQIVSEVIIETEVKISDFTPKEDNKIHIVFVPPKPEVFINASSTEAEITFYAWQSPTETRTIKVNKIGRIEFTQVE
ncbi:MAG: hypothetical protein PHH17_03295 [Candidatus Pacebacteria bacterium]|jgi:hypothetical protein|nr:hypothetical protein [Candidatus Paceibacterota bacterium]MDD3072784.1 hypothetical protein [Candidatus Paceibacterota bacterium]MDD3729312.1 hypothetical protein [Candidatus Paceibacterota bacterium]MDD4201820.1 hypothetical protein [Candidatus Paceibacterota bacterium]MDD4467015.1 hypothetical protein [Candidatus Paceibacterota bacterium]